jgi:hypothetical protein
MRGPELERLLALADEVDELHRRVRAADLLAAEIAENDAIVAALPAVLAAARAARAGLEPVARELEREWVDQAPLVTGWQRAVELEQLAEAAGADPGEYREAAGAARLRVEAARLRTREHRESIDDVRSRVTGVLEETPYAASIPAPGGDERPEAARRDALELADAVATAARAATADAAVAAARARDRRAELERLGAPADLGAHLEELRGRLPGEVVLPADAPPSAAARLARAGVRVR